MAGTKKRERGEKGEREKEKRDRGEGGEGGRGIVRDRPRVMMGCEREKEREKIESAQLWQKNKISHSILNLFFSFLSTMQLPSSSL